MLASRLARATSAATFVLLVIGGMVHATGSSLACPDWPLCYGQFFPAMEGGVLFEHGHRLAALVVGLLTAATAVATWRSRRERSVRWMSALAVLLVLFQASLGAVTVLWKLPLLVSSGHLATSMAFFAVTLWLAWRLAPPSVAAVEAPARGALRALAGISALVVYGQIVLGAVVRHTGSGLACGTEAVLCQGTLWPLGGPGQLQMLHRLAGVAAAALASAAGLAAMRTGPRRARRVGALLPAVALAQVLLGAWTVWSLIAVPVVSLHLGFGALLLAGTLTLFLLLGPRPAPVLARGGSAEPGLMPAAG